MITKNNSCSLKKLRDKAYEINHQVVKGFVHYRDVVDYDRNGERHTGYMVKNLENGFYVLGCYNENFDFLWDLDDVAEFLKERYEALGLTW